MTLIDWLTTVANGGTGDPDITVQARIDGWLANRVDPLPVGTGEEIAAALRGRTQQRQADSMIPILRRVKE